MADDRGILSYGAYLPRRRLQRKSIAAANSWFAPGLLLLLAGLALWEFMENEILDLAAALLYLLSQRDVSLIWPLIRYGRRRMKEAA